MLSGHSSSSIIGWLIRGDTPKQPAGTIPGINPSIVPKYLAAPGRAQDSFKIGRISWAQLDMPAKPLLEDRLRSGFSEAAGREAFRAGSLGNGQVVAQAD